MNRLRGTGERRKRQRRLVLENLEQRLPLAGDTFLINFQLVGSPIPNQYLPDTGEVFGDRGLGLFYGWSSDHTDVSRDREANPDQRIDTLIQFRELQEWELQLPNGDYEVEVSVGDGQLASNYTLFVEGVNYWNAESIPAGEFRSLTQQVTVSDGRLTLDSGNAADLATRINYIHVQGLAAAGNAPPLAPTIMEPAFGSNSLNPTDVHMEAIGFFDGDGDSHLSSDWEIWSTGADPERVWFTLGIQGVERLHTHLGDGFFENSHAGRFDLFPSTAYELRVRFRDDAGSVSDYATRGFGTGDASTTFPLELEDVRAIPTPTWVDLFGADVELPSAGQITTPADPIIAIDTDGNSNYPGNEDPPNAIDGSLDKYLNFGEINSGFIVTPVRGASTVTSFQVTTANDAEERDPTAWSLYGTNDTIVSADNSRGNLENWTLIDSGGLALPSSRNAPGQIVNVTNSTTFTSYRMVFTGVKNAAAANSMQLAEIQFFGTVASGPLIGASDSILAVDTDGNSSYPVNEEPQKAIDKTLAKYLNFGKENSGFIVSPFNASAVVESFQITTANDFEARDPASWELYGTNDPITSADNSTGGNETWTLVDAGVVALPAARDTEGPIVPVNATEAYGSYRMLFPTLKDAGATDSMQIAEVQFFGDATGGSMPSSLRLEGATGELLLEIEGSDAPGNTIVNPGPLNDHAALRAVVSGGSNGLNLSPSDLTFTDDDGQEHTVLFPSIALAANEEILFWVAIDGSTYYGTLGQTTPDFSFLARGSDSTLNFIATQPNYVVEVVTEDLQLPVNIAMIPNPGANPEDPLFYVTELYGTIKVVTNDGTTTDYATDLLNFNPTGNFPGSGEQGLAGIVVDPDTGDVYVTRVTDTDGLPGGAHHPQVLRFTSNDGGLTAATETVILDMVGESQGQSHQISNISIGPDDKLYVHNGDGFDASTAQNMDSYRGKVLRVNLDGSAPTDNPFYNAANGINSRDYIYAYGFRNPFGGAWRASDGKHYEVENGPSVDRFAQVNEGVNYGWDGSNASMFINSIYNWDPAHAPVNVTFVEPETFGGSGFPAEKMDRAFVSESGPTYAQGPQSLGKRIVEFELDENGQVFSEPTTLVEYIGPGRATVVGLAPGPDGLYFTDLYKDLDPISPIDRGARVLRVRYIPPMADGDFNDDGMYDCNDIDALIGEIAQGTNAVEFDMTGDGLVDLADRDAWLTEAGSFNLGPNQAYLLGDATLDGVVDGQDFIAWNGAKFTATGAWCDADFNADGVTDGQDFIIWNGNKFQSSDAVRPAMVEPAAVSLPETVAQPSLETPAVDGPYDRQPVALPRAPWQHDRDEERAVERETEPVDEDLGAEFMKELG